MSALLDTAQRETTGHELRVPWATVLPLAVVLAYADGFWMVSLRGAVGAIERTDAPFTTWLWESTLLLPVYVLAVLAALTLALRWFGPHPRRAGAAATTALLVVAAATFAAAALLTASAAYDYQLQSAHLETMSSTHGTCGLECLAEQRRATLALHVRAVGLGSLLVLASNLVLVALVVAFRGRRLNVAAPPRRPSARVLDDPRLFLAAGLFGAAAIHAAVVPQHDVEWRAAAIFFVLLCAAEAAVAVLVVAVPRPAVLLTVAVLSAGPLLLWLYSRTSGLSFGPEAGVAEEIGVADAAASLLEGATLVAAIVLLRARARPRRARTSQHLGRLALVAVVAVTLLGLGGALSTFEVAGHESAPSLSGTTGATADTLR